MGDEYGQGEDYLSSEVKQFIKNLNKSLKTREVYDTRGLYTLDFNSLTDRYFKASPWPSADSVKSVVDDKNFLILYKELYFRHIYAKLTPSVDDRLDSFENYVNLFNILITLNPKDPELELPAVWIWDIIDEFVSQFRAFHSFRTNVPSMKHEILGDELESLRANEHHWSAHSVIRYLYTLSKKAGFTHAGKVDIKDNSVMFKMVGEFSQIGLARVNVLLGDYTSALQALDNIDLANSDPLSPLRVVGCHASVAYHAGVSYLMLKRYSDATECFAGFLGFYGRRKNNLKPHQEDLVANMYGLLAISLALSPEPVEDSLQKSLRDKFGDKLSKSKMEHGDVSGFEELFYECGPQYISPKAPDYDKDLSTHQEATKLQLKVFSAELRQRSRIPTIESYLKLCTAVTAKKLGDFLKCEPDALHSDLMMIRHKTKELKRTSSSAPASSGEWSTQTAKTPFYVASDVVHVANSKPVDRFGQTFISNIMKYEDLIDDIKRI